MNRVRVRPARGALVTAAATAVCHSVLSLGYAWARAADADSGGAAFGGIVEFGATTLTSWALMPLLLWAGMRLLREHGTVLLTVVGALAWFLLSGYFMDDVDSAGGHVPPAALAAYVLLGAALAVPGTAAPARRPARPRS
ncbi:hypothetical protein [Streptomyces yaizuensis]|uniref:Uncharacterized protein n=1 Tax=Streptomyces yaizuensis TaxID=2989713 RepID=A0ABQ5NRV0_9ACTN|nr:hypothetical protein [Streptomyces sp. YSPA8]GLF93070.1 hypothetical protein SYYSPA8_02255 [Streptomyces sp. YSPA8]